MRNIKNLLIVFALSLSILTVAYAVSVPSDIAKSRYKNAIEFLYEQGVVQGYEDGTFRPTYELNRAELLKFVAGTKGKTLDAAKYKNCFPDVKRIGMQNMFVTQKVKAGSPDTLVVFLNQAAR